MIAQKTVFACKDCLFNLYIFVLYLHTSIKTCHITYYIYADTDDDALTSFCHEALQKSYIYHTLRRAMDLTIQFTPLV